MWLSEPVRTGDEHICSGWTPKLLLHRVISIYNCICTFSTHTEYSYDTAVANRSPSINYGSSTSVSNPTITGGTGHEAVSSSRAQISAASTARAYKSCFSMYLLEIVLKCTLRCSGDSASDLTTMPSPGTPLAYSTASASFRKPSTVRSS